MFKFDYQDESVSAKPKFTKTSDTLLQPGLCKFKIKSASTVDRKGEPLFSQNGEPKMKIDLYVIDAQGTGAWCYEHITAKNGWRLGKILKAIGRSQYYNANGEIDPKVLVGGSGQCVVKTRPPQNGYKAQNAIDGYVDALEPELTFPGVIAAKAAEADPQDDIPNDELPF